jgi:hypothetical protein
MNEQAHAGLRLQGSIVGLGESAEQEIASRWQFTAVMDYIYSGVGCPTPEEPNKPYPTLTVNDLTTANGKRYSEVYLTHIEWADYLEQKRTLHEAELVLVTAQMDEIARGIRVNMRKSCTRKNAKGALKLPTTTEMDDEIGEDPQYKELARKKAFLKAVLLVLTGICSGRVAYNSLISRQVEIRRQDWENQNRSGSIQGKRGVPNEGREPRRQT